MASLKFTLDQRRVYKDGRNPLIIRLSDNGRSTSIHLGIKLIPKEWDGVKQKILRKHGKNKELNMHLKEIMLGYEQKLLKLSSTQQHLSLKELREALINTDKNYNGSFYEFALEQISKLKSNNRFGNAQSYLTATNRVIEFSGKNLKLSSIDYAYVLELESYLAQKGVGVNGIAAYMRALRALLNIGGKLNVYDMTLYPFNQFKIRTAKTPSRAITNEKINELIKLEIDTSDEQYHARNMFLLIFSLIGISFMDLLLLKKSNIQDDRIIYKRRKTGKLYSVKITSLSQSILDEYKDSTSIFLLPQFGLDGVNESKVRHRVNLGLKSTNRYLKKIGKQLGFESPLTTYVARYSWANIAKSSGYSNDLIAEALGHSYGNQVTGIYLDGYGNEIIDNANKHIVSLIKS